jgi:hydrogenase-4 component E
MTLGDDVLILCAAGMLVTAYLIVGQKALFTAIRLYGLQSLLLGIVAVTIAVWEGRHDLFVTAALTVTLKAILIPWFLMRVIDRIGIHREIEPFLSVPASLLVCLGLTVVGYRVSTGFPEGARGVSHHLIGAALSMLLIGLFLMVTRKKAISQILALLTVENAVFLVAVGVTAGMPLIVELGIAFDVILAVLVLGVLVERIVHRFESMDVSRLSKLKG